MHSHNRIHRGQGHSVLLRKPSLQGWRCLWCSCRCAWLLSLFSLCGDVPWLPIGCVIGMALRPCRALPGSRPVAVHECVRASCRGALAIGLSNPRLRPSAAWPLRVRCFRCRCLGCRSCLPLVLRSPLRPFVWPCGGPNLRVGPSNPPCGKGRQARMSKNTRTRGRGGALGTAQGRTARPGRRGGTPGPARHNKGQFPGIWHIYRVHTQWVYLDDVHTLTWKNSK